MLRTLVRSSAFIIWMNCQNTDACKLEYSLRKYLTILWYGYVRIYYENKYSFQLVEINSVGEIHSYFHAPVFNEIFFQISFFFIEIFFINISSKHRCMKIRMLLQRRINPIIWHFLNTQVWHAQFPFFLTKSKSAIANCQHNFLLFFTSKTFFGSGVSNYKN